MLLIFALSLLILYIPVPLSGTPLPWEWTVGGVGLLLLAHVGVCWLAFRLAASRAEGESEDGGVRIYRAVRGAIVIFLLVDTLVLQWPFFVQRELGRLPWTVLVDDAVMLLPAVVMVVITIMFRHALEAKRGTVSLRWGRYIRLRLRMEVGPLLVSWLGIALLSDLFAVLYPASPAGAGVGFMVLLCAGVVVAGPAVLTWVWRTSSLQEGPMRVRLEELCEREGLRCRDLLLWHTHRHVHNAAVVGFLPSLRYILISDAMALHFSAEEIEAVFAHEIGHVKLHHMRYYGIFAVSFLPFYATLLDGLAALDLVWPLHSLALMELDVWQALVLLVFAAAYWSLGFGFVSRRFEREADHYAAGTTDPEAFMTALEKLARLGGRPRGSASWRHFSIDDRLAFIRQVRDKPERATRVAGVARWLRVLLCTAAGAAVVRIVLWRPELIGL